MYSETNIVISKDNLPPKMRILICRSNPVAPDPRVEKEAATLTEAGYVVAAIAWDQTASLPVIEHTENLTIERIPIRVKNAHGLGNLPYVLVWQVRLLWQLIAKRNTYDIIHACDFDTILPALVINGIWHKKLIYDIFDFYADMMRLTPKPIVYILRHIELWAINQVDAIILPDTSRYQQIKGSHPKKSVVIYNSPQETIPSEGIKRIGNTDSHFRLAYVGNLQVQRGLLHLLDILKRYPDWELDLAGFGPDEALILDYVKGMPNIRWHGRVPYSRALDLNRRADVLIALYDPSVPNHRYASPNKAFEAMMLGKPVIVARNTNVDEIIEQVNCGLVVDYEDIATLETALLLLRNDPKVRNRMGYQARKAYEETYSWEKMKVRLLNLYKEIVF